MIGLSVLSLVYVLALFGWKKWGFWGLLMVSGVKIVLELVSGGADFMVLSGIVVSILILFGVLQIGRGNKGWPQLR